MMNKGIKALLSILLACVMAGSASLYAVPLRADATQQNRTVENKVDLEKEMSLTVGINSGSEVYLERLAAEDGTLVYDLYRIADVVESGSSFSYEICQEFNNLEEELKKASTSGSASDRINYSEFAQLALEEIVGSAGTYVNESTQAAYSGLSLKQANCINSGLYLLVARGTIENSTVVKSVSVGNSDREDHMVIEGGLATYTLLGSTYFTISPLIICAPTKTAEDGSVLETNIMEGNWVYDQTVILKMLSDPATGSIQIDKTLTGYFGDAENATFVFQVDTYFPTENNLYSSEVYSLQFTEPGTKSLIVEGLPIGSKVKVYEIYSGNAYTASIAYPDSIDVEVTKGEIPVASFTNSYNKRTNGGGGVTNHFSYGIQEGVGHWFWEKVMDNTTTSNGLTTRLLQSLLNAVNVTEH